jgi:hypothetical protein
VAGRSKEDLSIAHREKQGSPVQAEDAWEEHLLLLSKSALMHSRLIPQREFYPIANTNLVVDDAEIIANDMLAYP